jgi:hypothetical protein
MQLTKDFKEFIELLNAHEVKYLVIGGYAVNYHGYIRFTGDIDIWVWMDRNNIQKLLAVIREFGFLSLKLQESDFLSPKNVIQFGVEPDRIDILVDIEGLGFPECYERRETENKDDLLISIISFDDLVKAKEAAGRPQDIADISRIKKVREKKTKK